MPSERFTGLAAVLGAIRGTEGVTQPVLVERVGLGRSVVAQRVAELEAAGLVASDGVGPSTGGRAPRRFRLRAEEGFVVGVDIASHELVVGIADLSGAIQATEHEHIRIADGPEAVLGTAECMIRALVRRASADGKLCSVGLGMPDPVASAGGSPSLPTMPGWDLYRVPDRLASLCSAPVWMDDRVNLLALGERRVSGSAARSQHMLYLGGGATVGAAAVVDGAVYRGARGLAGAIGHMTVAAGASEICRCGNTGCLESVVGGSALVHDARRLAEMGRSPALAAVLRQGHALRPIDVTRAAEDGDPAASALLRRAGTAIGTCLAALVNVMNPDLVVIGGGIARAGTHILEPITAAILRHGWPVATQGLRIELSSVDEEIAGVIGAIQFAIDQLLSRDHLPTLLVRDNSSDAAAG